jgi:hypothetical protein
MAFELYHGGGAVLLMAIATVASLCTSGCAHRAAATIRDGTTTISGNNTVRMTASDTRRVVLIEAAAITVDHGYRLFEITTPIRPGADVAIRLYGKGEADPHASGVYDADAIAAGKLP